MSKKPVTIHDIARKLGISASTVSRALIDHPRISEKTRQLVRKTAESMNYRPNLMASGLRTGKARNIGLIVPKINRFFFADTISGIESVTSPAGYNLIICQSNENLQKEIENIRTLLSSRVDGIIISISAQTRSSLHLKSVIEQGIPLVQFDRISPEVDSCKVLNDNYQAAYDVTSHLIEQGYRKIAYFSGPLQINIYRERFEGYRSALALHHLSFEKNMYFEGPLDHSFGERSTQKLLKKARPDAVFSAGDYAALGTLLTLKSLRIRVPEDIGVAGFANEQATEYSNPPITTVDQFAHILGSTSAELLLEQITQERSQRLQKTITIKPRLICRASTLRKSS